MSSSFHKYLMPNITDKYDIQKQKMLNRAKGRQHTKGSEITTFVLLTLKRPFGLYITFSMSVSDVTA